jgi:hypothetical protein
MLKVGLNFLRDPKKGMLEKLRCYCHYNVCSSIGESRDVMCLVPGKVYKSITQLRQDCVCGKSELKEWHKRECFLCEYHDCGVHKLPLCPNEITCNFYYKVSWKCFETSVVGQYENRKLKKRIKEVLKETSTTKYLTYLKPNLQKFIKDNFVACWQDTQCKLAMLDLPKDVILSHIDFAENYTFQIDNEIQSMHWHSFQVTILVHIMYRLKPIYNETNS